MAGAQDAQHVPGMAADAVKAEEEQAVKCGDGAEAASSLELEAGQAPAEPQAPSQAPAKRGRRREREAEDAGADELRWGLKRKIAALSRDVELLSHEAARVRQRADATCSDPQLTPAEVAAVAERHARRLAEAQKRNISVLLRDIMSHKWAFPFALPVDTSMYRDYLTRVAAPMDFGTIRGRLEAGRYAAQPDAFAADMRLVFANAFTYNPPGSDVHAMATTLRDKFEDRWKGVTARLAATAAERTREERELREAARRRLQEQALRGLIPERERLAGTFAALEARCREAKSEAAAGCAFMTLEDKRALGAALAGLRTDEFEAAIQLALVRHPGLLGHTTEEFDLNLGEMDALTLRQLAAFCRACARGRGRGGGGGGARWPGLVFGAGAAGDRALRKAAADGAQPVAAAAAGQPAPAAAGAVPGQATPGQAAQPAAAGGGAAAAQPPAQARHVGERSWSVLDRDARLLASDAQSPPKQTPAAPLQTPAVPLQAPATELPPAAAPAAAAAPPTAAAPARPPLVVAEASTQGLAAPASQQPAPAAAGSTPEPQ